MHNNLSLHMISRVAAFIVLVFSIYLFFTGHHNPGGGFIGGLMTASGVLLLYLSFDLNSIKSIIKINYAHLIAIGLLLTILTGGIGVLFGYSYLKHFFDYFTLPFIGEVELTTALPFDLGIYLVVIGITLLSTLTIAEDE
ncbi:Na(+)/H(+) antiporter subunit B [Bacillus horti]|uniref:Multicomponent Na+:H+ antiporter subunit B n=1 Tax=Caldalkalibacillus horti TaxID=77523 RepID=A0ABT9VYF7_9BACI|nr:Na(+)/H(+) antiporter subunit B [Bacillus horti]MDQ0165645.1 multicomponent Na+:H+ antiporter subunit B [Bacillus horti]